MTGVRSTASPSIDADFLTLAFDAVESLADFQLPSAVSLEDKRCGNLNTTEIGIQMRYLNRAYVTLASLRSLGSEQLLFFLCPSVY